jgi:DNA-binding MarR family transcriptional regulator
MKTSKDPSQTYLRFLNLVSAIRGLPAFPALDALEERILNGLAATWATGTKVTVLEAMELTLNTSPTTVHRRLKSLRQKGLIELREDEVDSRIKYVMPTEIAKTYFDKMGQCLDMAARG